MWRMVSASLRAAAYSARLKLSARPAAPSLRRAVSSRSVLLSSGRRAARRPAISSAGKAPRCETAQRERMVGSSSPRFSARRRMWT